MPTIDELIRLRADDHHCGLKFGDRTWTYAQVVAAQADRAAILVRMRNPGPFHVALLLTNVPEYIFWLGAAALCGAVVVGANPTHRGDELARDLSHTDCQLLITDVAYSRLIDGYELGTALPPTRILIIDTPEGDLIGGSIPLTPYGELLAGAAGAPLPNQTETEVDEASLGLLLFTSGTSGAPKACLCSQGRLARIGAIVAQMFDLTSEDVCYIPMPLFHSNALMTGWAPALSVGASVALREHFSASLFLADLRAFGATYFNYVGKPLSYVLATPERPDDADNPLRRAFGNEAAEADIARFAERFGCTVQDAYGSTEGGASVTRTADAPQGALGRALPGTLILNSETEAECPRARFNDQGQLLNADEAIGEMVSTTGGTGFEGYWRNDEANAARLRHGWYWTGDLAYRDAEDFFYFAGRDYDWLRVDGENFAAAPVEAILNRHPDIVLASVYAVPDIAVGDQVMVALLLRPGAEFHPEGFVQFLSDQRDLGTKGVPKFIRIAFDLPLTATSKVLKRVLRNEAWHCEDTVWWRPSKVRSYRVLSSAEITELDRQVAGR